MTKIPITDLMSKSEKINWLQDCIAINKANITRIQNLDSDIISDENREVLINDYKRSNQQLKTELEAIQNEND